MKAILLSGGMDSTALTFFVRPELAIAIDYGQVTAAAELESADRVAAYAQLPLEVLHVNARHVGGGVMAGRRPDMNAPCPEWWPYRNQFLVTVAAMHGYRRGVNELLMGAVVSDADAHLDGRPEFFLRLSQLLAYQEGNLVVTTPAIMMTTTELIQKSHVPLELIVASHSCHMSNLACGQCRGCWKREKVLYDLGLVKD